MAEASEDVIKKFVDQIQEIDCPEILKQLEETYLQVSKRNIDSSSGLYDHVEKYKNLLLDATTTSTKLYLLSKDLKEFEELYSRFENNPE